MNYRAAGQYSSLCFPDGKKSCFRCCPPIREADYDHLEHRDAVVEMLERNTNDLDGDLRLARVINGRECWGLGYLDAGGTLIGCMLHPEANEGVDLRDLTGYGDKCRRELCLEAKAFQLLDEERAAFVLQLSDGLDSIEYSSVSANPVFRLLRWGSAVIDKLMLAVDGNMTRPQYLRDWGMFADELNPVVHRFPIEILMERIGLTRLSDHEFLEKYLSAVNAFISSNKVIIEPPLDNRPFVHQLVSEPIAGFLRHGLGRFRASPAEIEKINKKLHALLSSL